MKLLVDLGNSRVKWAFGAADRFVAVGEAPYAGGTELRLLLDAGFAPDAIRIANVTGADAGARLAAALRERFGVAPVFAGSAAGGAGVRNGYADPAQLGIDRWLAICAAFDRYRAPVCVVDAGTATTIDVVAGSGEHQGGLILPGLGLMESALLGGTGDLARLAASSRPPGDAPAPATGPVALGRDTAAAIRNGALQATAGLAAACLQRTGSGLLILTGGAAPPLVEVLLRMAPAMRLEQRPHLVLEGLALEPACFRAAT
ncbi:MAG: type III pantothenate kinase [Gammaproteobacteria bacterium]